MPDYIVGEIFMAQSRIASASLINQDYSEPVRQNRWKRPAANTHNKINLPSHPAEAQIILQWERAEDRRSDGLRQPEAARAEETHCTPNIW